ncbi:MAG TPA: hypothetical protein VH722_21025 [Alphaproteobacteria bacterium]|nr:hypothetical protein [Alphaproteobacteria bacterium]
MAVKVLVEAGVTATDRRTDQRMDHGATVPAGAGAVRVGAARVAVAQAAAHSVPMARFLTSTA